MTTKWLKNLKKGDQVIHSNRLGDSICTVEKIYQDSNYIKRKTLISLKEVDAIFNKSNGRVVGYHWCSASISEVPPEKQAEVREEMHKRKMLNKIHKIDFSKLSYESLTDIYEVLIRKRR